MADVVNIKLSDILEVIDKKIDIKFKENDPAIESLIGQVLALEKRISNLEKPPEQDKRINSELDIDKIITLKPSSGSLDEPDWLTYGNICEHDDAFLCECRFDYLKKHVKKNLELNKKYGPPHEGYSQTKINNQLFPSDFCETMTNDIGKILKNISEIKRVLASVVHLACKGTQQ